MCLNQRQVFVLNLYALNDPPPLSPPYPYLVSSCQVRRWTTCTDIIYTNYTNYNVPCVSRYHLRSAYPRFFSIALQDMLQNVSSECEGSKLCTKIVTADVLLGFCSLWCYGHTQFLVPTTQIPTTQRYTYTGMCNVNLDFTCGYCHSVTRMALSSLNSESSNAFRRSLPVYWISLASWLTLPLNSNRWEWSCWFLVWRGCGDRYQGDWL